MLSICWISLPQYIVVPSIMIVLIETFSIITFTSERETVDLEVGGFDLDPLGTSTEDPRE